jgi:hypothetical protein
MHCAGFFTRAPPAFAKGPAPDTLHPHRLVAYSLQPTIAPTAIFDDDRLVLAAQNTDTSIPTTPLIRNGSQYLAPGRTR